MSTNVGTVLITGASIGLGYEIAQAFLGKGSNVVLNSSNEKKLREAAEKLDNASKVAFVAGDIGRKETSQKMVRLAVDRFGSVNVLVNNAGVFSPKPFLEVDEDELDKFLNINLKGTYFASQAAIAQMLKQEGGAIVNIGTVLVGHAIGGFPVTAPTTSKGAIHTLTGQLAAEFGKNNIRVNTIAPGIIRTSMHARNGIEDVDSLAGLHLLNRVGEPEDIANAVLYLATANFVTGQILRVDGGHGAGHHLSS
jgi:NAD(P)-dependent dehydrogenase (short-subunit alcohol dehydrogenase family)